MPDEPSYEELELKIEALEEKCRNSMRMEDKLRESREQFRSLAELSPNMIFINRSGKVVYANKRCEEVTGYAREEFYSTDFEYLSIIAPEYHDLMTANFKTHSEGKEVASCEIVVLTRAGRRINAILSTRLITYRGDPAILGTITDITDRKEMEETLRRSEATFRSFAECAPDYIVHVDYDGTIQFTNRTYETVSLSEVVGTSIYSWLPEETRPKFRSTLIQLLESGRPEVIEYSAPNARGQMIWYSAHMGLIRVEGLASGAILIIRDIDERKRAEDALDASEKRYRAVVENQTELICRFLPEGTLTFVNDAYCRYFGKGCEDLVGRRFMPFIPEEDRNKVERHFASITPQNPVATHEHRVIAADGSLRWHQWTNQGIFDDQGYLLEYQSVGRDVTELKKLGEELSRIEKLESLGLLAGGIAHDFNNLLTPIMSNISMARIYGEPDREIGEMLADAEKAALRAKSLTQQLLTFSKGGAPVKRPASISKLVEEASKFALSGSKVNCHYSISEDLWPVEVDEGQIAQVIQNLIINADQAMPRGGTIEVRAENVGIGKQNPLVLGKEKYVRISIRDQGIGISEKDMSNIFDPFFTTKQRGSGLGLSTSFTIVEKHEGTIQVESELGVGTTFHVYLPSSAERLVVEKPKRADTRTGKGRILVVDDEEAVRKVIAEVLSRLGYQGRFAQDGTEAIRLYEEAMKERRPFDAVITDLTIPGGMGGKEAIKQLKKIDQQAKVIVSSGYSEDPVLANFKDHGFCAVLTKPYSADDLADVVHQALDAAKG